MTKTKATTHKAEHKTDATKTLRDVLEEIKSDLLKLENSSSHGEFRAACQSAIGLIEKYLGDE